MTTWEYLVVQLTADEFGTATAAPPGDLGAAAAPALAALNAHGRLGWEAVGMTPAANDATGVLLKRPLPQGRASGGR